MDDRGVIAAQIGRPARARADVVTRCHLGLPVVVRMPPLLEDGTPFPTRYWLTCPLAVRRVGRLEGAGGVRAVQRRAEADAAFGARLAAAHDRYAADRNAALPEGGGPRPSGGIGGGDGVGVKCLHAHYADFGAGHDNPIGEMTAPWVEPLDCAEPCVVPADDGAISNPSWREPA